MCVLQLLFSDVMDINAAGIDLYENLGDDDEFNKEEEVAVAVSADSATSASQEATFADAIGVEDLYDDVITGTDANGEGPHVDDLADAQSQPHMTSGARYHGKRVAMYVGNLTWWTTDQDLITRVAALGIHDIVEIKFHENRQNGQSKGFCVVVFGSDQSARIVQEKLVKTEIHGQSPVVTPCNKQSLNYFEQQAGGSRNDESYGGGGGGGGGGGNNSGGGSGGRSYHHQGGQYSTHGHGHSQVAQHGNRIPQGGHMGMPPQGMPLPRGPSVGPPNMGGPPPMGPPHMGAMPGMIPPHMRPPPHSQMSNLPPRSLPPGHPAAAAAAQAAAAAAAAAAAQAYQSRLPVDSRLMTPGTGMPRGLGAPAQQPAAAPPQQQHMVLPPQSSHPSAMPASGGAATQPSLHSMIPGQQHPQPHVNPAFLAAGGAQSTVNNTPASGLPASGGAYAGQQTPTPNSTATLHSQTGAVDVYGRPLQAPAYPNVGMQPQDASVMGLSEKDIQEIFNRNKTVSSSAISRAVQDAAAGDYASAIETLVTAISLIRQSKIASDDRCKILINSLQDTLHGIETKSYGSSVSKSSSSRRRRRSYSDSGSDGGGGDLDGAYGSGGNRRSRERGRSGSRSRSDKRRRGGSRERESYRERSRERDYYSRSSDRRDYYARH